MLTQAPTTPRWAIATQAADKLTATYTRPPIPVHRIAEENGVDIVFADFGKHTKTVAGFCDFNQAKLFVNREDRQDRQSFTIAHELGHWILHRDLFRAKPDLYPILPRFADPNKDDPLEKEANKFAANLLVPGHLLEPIKSAPITILAKAFGVSSTMMGFRVRNV